MRDTELKVDESKIVIALTAIEQVNLEGFKVAYNNLTTDERFYFISNYLDSLNIVLIPWTEEFEDFVLDCAHYKIANKQRIAEKFMKIEDFENVLVVNKRINEANLVDKYADLYKSTQFFPKYNDILALTGPMQNLNIEQTKFKEFVN